MAQCDNCKYWQSYKGSRTSGRCRRHAPIVIPNVGGFLTVISTSAKIAWPDTAYDDWCGEYEPEPIQKKNSGSETLK